MRLEWENLELLIKLMSFPKPILIILSQIILRDATQNQHQQQAAKRMIFTLLLLIFLFS